MSSRAFTGPGLLGKVALSWSPAAQVQYGTLGTAGLARLAGVAAVQDQPVVGVEQKGLGHAFEQGLLDRQRRLSSGQSGSVADPEDMRIHGHGRLTEGGIEYHVGGLPADAGQGLELGPGPGDLAVMLVDQ